MVYGMKMAFTVYLHMFHICHARAAYNIVHLFLVLYLLLHFIFKWPNIKFKLYGHYKDPKIRFKSKNTLSWHPNFQYLIIFGTVSMAYSDF